MATIKGDVDLRDAEIAELKALWDTDPYWGDTLEEFAAREDLELIQDGKRTLIVDKRPLREVNPELADPRGTQAVGEEVNIERREVALGYWIQPK